MRFFTARKDIFAAIDYKNRTTHPALWQKAVRNK